jgi:hypothetical protein
MIQFGNAIVGEVEITKKIQLTENDIETIIVNGLEGGINYWAGLDSHKNSMWLETKPKDEPISTWATKKLIENGKIILHDIEAPEETEVLTLEKLINGYRLNCIERPEDCNIEIGDASTYDCIIQYALFGEIVYG